MTEIEITLGPLDSTDLGLIRSWRNDYNIWRWCRQVGFISDAEQIRWFNKQSEDPTIKMFKILAKTNEKAVPVGVCGLTSLDYLNRRAEFSLYTAPDVQRRGIGQHALSILLEHSFNNLGLNLIWGETFEHNPAQRMFEKLGFKREGTRRSFYFRDGRFIDAHLYSITAEEFHASRTHHQPDDQPAAPLGDSVVHFPGADPAGSNKPPKRRHKGASGKAGAEKADQP